MDRRRTLRAAAAGAVVAGVFAAAAILSNGGTACTSPPAARDASAGPWERAPADRVATSARCGDWAGRLFDHADAAGTLADVKVSAGLVDSQYDYSIPVYQATAATPLRRVFPRPGWPGSFKLTRGTRIPWDPSWHPAGGSDGHAVVVAVDGTEWDLWGLSTPQHTPGSRPQLGCSFDLGNLADGYNPRVDLCAATLARGEPGSPAFPVGNLSLGVVEPEAVAAGRVEEVVGLVVGKQSSMTGPACPPSVPGPDDPRVGVSCGIAVAPAGQHESRNIRSTTGQLEQMVPDGTRFVVRLTDSDITSWLDRRGYRGRLRDTARVLAEAISEDPDGVRAAGPGVIVTHTSAGGASITLDGSDPQAWRDLGIRGDGRDLLAGLIDSADRIRVLEPPLAACTAGVASRRSCRATAWSY